MRYLVPIFLLVCSARGALSAPWDMLHERSISRSRQFVVYAPDPNSRAAIAMDADDVKDRFLKLIGVSDDWKNPIVIQVSPANTADPSLPASDVQIVNTVGGFKIDLTVELGSDPRDAHFPEQLVRALLLEFCYRNQTGLIASNAPYTDPPAWLVNGISSLTAEPDPDTNASLFRSLILSGRTPTLATFLSEKPESLDGPSLRLYSACSMSLVKLLLQLPNGQALMQSFARHLPGPSADPEVELLKAFPTLNSGNQSLEKWWTLGLASLSAGDRYQGLSLADTSQQLDATLKFDVAIDKAGTTKPFSLDQYSEFQKAPGAKAALTSLGVRLMALEAQSSPMMREVISAYQTLAVQLAHGEDAHLKAHLNSLADYRTHLTGRMDQIADYLNWYEATQRTQASGSFDEYIRTADKIATDPGPVRTDPISKYMDSVEQQLAQ